MKERNNMTNKPYLNTSVCCKRQAYFAAGGGVSSMSRCLLRCVLAMPLTLIVWVHERNATAMGPSTQVTDS